MKCAQTVFLVDEAVKRVKRVFISNVLWITARVVADLLECSVHGYVCQPRTAARSVGRAVAPTLEAESREGQPGDTWVSSECQSALGVGRAVDSRIDQVCQEHQTTVAPGSSTVISIVNLKSRGHIP